VVTTFAWGGGGLLYSDLILYLVQEQGAQQFPFCNSFNAWRWPHRLKQPFETFQNFTSSDIYIYETVCRRYSLVSGMQGNATIRQLGTWLYIRYNFLCKRSVLGMFRKITVGPTGTSNYALKFRCCPLQIFRFLHHVIKANLRSSISPIFYKVFPRNLVLDVYIKFVDQI
jgi:hypothetical protein